VRQPGVFVKRSSLGRCGDQPRCALRLRHVSLASDTFLASLEFLASWKVMGSMIRIVVLLGGKHWGIEGRKGFWSWVAHVLCTEGRPPSSS